MGGEVKEKDALVEQNILENEDIEAKDDDTKLQIDENVSEDIEENVDEKIEYSVKPDVVTVLAKDAKNHNDIVQSAKASQDIARKKYDEYVKADLELEKKTIDFIQQENEILKTTVDTTISLLNSLNANSLEDVVAQISEIQKDNKEELLDIKTPSKGSAKGFLIGTIGTLLTFSGAMIAGAKMAGLPINMATLLEKVNLDKIVTKYSELLHLGSNATAGYALVGVSSILVGVILYKLIVWLQKRKNLKYINSIEENLTQYLNDLDAKIDDIFNLKQHIDNIQLVMQKYDIILQEQNAKIRRMLFIEQPEDGVNSLQKASKLEVEKTVLILDELLKLMNTPINEGLKIREESNQRLHSANSVINEVIKKLYI